jgi:hypothetical protein
MKRDRVDFATVIVRVVMHRGCNAIERIRPPSLSTLSPREIERQRVIINIVIDHVAVIYIYPNTLTTYHLY